MPNLTISQAVIFAGGEGTRLRPLTYTIPKPMIRFHDKPFLEYLLLELKRNSITNIVLLVGYLYEQIEGYFGDGSKWGLQISYSRLPSSADTGTRLQEVMPRLDPYFLLLYGDNFWPFRIQEVLHYFEKHALPVMVTVYSNTDSYTKNNMLVKNGQVERYDRQRSLNEANGVDIGFFLMNKRALHHLPKGNFSFEDVMVQRLIRQKKLAAYVTHHKYYGLSNPDRMPAIEEFFRPKKIILLDRDGVINKKTTTAQYILHWRDFVFIPRVIKGLQLLANAGYTFFVVTNQSGVGRKMMTVDDLDQIHQYMRDQLHKHGVEIKQIYVCMHSWDEQCFCRKPNPGLFFQAAAEHHFNLYDSFCIGDDVRDMEAGRLAGCRSIFIGDTSIKVTADAKHRDLYAAARFILQSAV